MGQTPHEPSEKDRKTVEMMAGHGITQLDIARVIGVSLTTLVKWYRDELETGAVKANSKVAQSLFEKATSNSNGSVAAAIFWLKCRARWTEPLPAEGYVGKKQQLQQAATDAGGAKSGWTQDLETEIRTN